MSSLKSGLVLSLILLEDKSRRMMLKHYKYVISSFFFLLFCFSMGHAQSNPTAIPSVLSQTLPTVQPNPATPPVQLDSTGKPVLSPGKYEEYQSICRLNEYDLTKYYSDDLKKRRTDFLKKKIANTSGDATRLKLRLLKEYIDQDDLASARALIDSLKKVKLSVFSNDMLNALIAYSTKNYNAATTTLNNLLSANENNIEILFFLGELYIKLENYYEAATIYEDLNKLTNSSYLVQLCEALVLNSVNAEGEKVCLQAINKFPDNPVPLIYKGISHREREEYKKTIAAFQKSINVKPTEMGYVCLAEAYYMKDKFVDAAAHFKKASLVSAKSIRAILGLAWTELKLKNYKDSLKAFKKACAVNGKYESEIRKATKELLSNKIPEAKIFMQAAEYCGG